MSGVAHLCPHARRRRRPASGGARAHVERSRRSRCSGESSRYSAGVLFFGELVLLFSSKLTKNLDLPVRGIVLVSPAGLDKEEGVRASPWALGTAVCGDGEEQCSWGGWHAPLSTLGFACPQVDVRGSVPAGRSLPRLGPRGPVRMALGRPAHDARRARGSDPSEAAGPDDGLCLAGVLEVPV